MHLPSVATVILMLLAATTCNLAARADDSPKPLKAGIIGLTTSHVQAFTRLLNDPNAEGVLADVKVVAAFPGGMKDNPNSWDRVEGYTKWIREQRTQAEKWTRERLARQARAVLAKQEADEK